LKRSHIITGLLVALAIIAACSKEEEANEPEAFAFITYPGARYLGQITEATRQAHKAIKPNEEPPPAYYLAGVLATDENSLVSFVPKFGLKPDITTAVGTYKAADIAPRPNRPRVTVQRPYFDVTTSQVVNRSIILMSR